MRIYHYSEMPDEAIGPDAPGSRRTRLNDVESAVSTAMIEVAPGGHTLQHSHPHEQTMFILEGAGEARDGSGNAPISPGVFIYVRPGEPHVVYNTGEKPLRFLSIEPARVKA